MPSSKSYRRILDEQTHALVAQGSHEAYLHFLKRYKFYSESLARELLASKYYGSGAFPAELVAVCVDRFPYVLKKFNPEICSFYTFWRNTVEQYIIDYMTDNYFSEKSMTQASYVSFNDSISELNSGLELLAESDDDTVKDRLNHDAKRLIAMHRNLFTPSEITLMLLLFDGYKLADYERSGIVVKSTMYLTFSRVCKKLEKLFKDDKKN